MNGAEPDGWRPLRERSQVLLRGRVFDVVASQLEFPSGLRQDLWVVEHPGAVGIAALTDAGELLLVRQYRHSARETTLEIPAGRLERGEDPLAAAQRELAEETGWRARSWRPLRRYLAASGFSSERITLFVARGLEPGTPDPDEDEELAVVRMTPERVLAESSDAKTLIAAGLLLLER